MNSYLGSVISANGLARSNDYKRFVLAFHSLFTTNDSAVYSAFVRLCPLVKCGAFSVNDAYYCLLAISRGLSDRYTSALRDIYFYHDTWNIPFSSFRCLTIKDFELCLKSLSITKFPLVALDSNGLPFSFIDNYVML